MNGRLIAMVALLIAACRTAPVVRSIDCGRMGTCRVFSPHSQGRAMIFVFSDAAGWSATLTDSAAGMAAHGATVIGIDLREYLRRLAASDDGCHYVVAEIEDASHRLQR